MTESTENTHSSTNFLNQDEISFLLNYPLGLRLTDNSGEITQGNTRGDAVPLAHLAGGADTIEFITLSAYMANPRNTNCSNIPHIRQRLEALYNAYTNYQTDKNLRRLNLKYLPKLMIHYAQLSHIGDAEDAYELENTAVLPQSELDVLLDIYQKLQGKGVLTLELVFDKNLSYYEALPILRLLLTTQFNQSLQDRLHYNYQYFCHNQTMYYLLLHSPRFNTGYDFARYPMGKAGTYGFLPNDVKAHTSFFLTTPEEHQQSLLKWLKSSLSALRPDAQKKEDTKRENTEHLNTTKITPSYWQQSVNFCHRNQGTVMLLLGIGIFSGLKALQTLQEIQPSNDTSYGV